MKPKGRYANEKGSIIWWVLIILVVVIVAVVAAIKYLPGFCPPPSPVVTRMKVPPIPPSEPPSPEPTVEDSAVAEKETPASLPPAEQEESGAPVTAQDPSPQTTEPEQAPEAMVTDVEPSIESPDTAPTPAPAAETTSESTPASDNGGVQAETADGEKQSQDKVMATQDRPMEEDEPAEKDKPAPATIPEQTDAADEPEAMATKDEEMAPEKPVEKPTGYTVQVGVFRNKVYAERKVEALKQLGYPSFLSPVVGADDQTLYLVRFGEFQTNIDAAAAAVEFSEKENMTAVVTRF